MEKIKILFIEDDQVDRMAFERFCEKEGRPYDVNIASTVSEAGEALTVDSFDVIVSDVQIGGSTIFELFPKFDDIPVIVASGTGDEEMAVKALKLGAFDYLVKDVERNYLKILPITIENAISHSKSKRLIGMLSHAMMSISDNVFITDMEHKIIFVNRAFLDNYGYKKDDVLGGEAKDIWSETPIEKDELLFLKRSLDAGGMVEVMHRRKDGTEFPVSLSRSVIRDDDGKEMAIVRVARDITHTKRLENELRALSLKDELTGIANRRSFDRLFDLEWNRAKRDRSPLSLIMIDIDNFKDYNDTYGHQAGDECLRSVARAIEGALKRPGDVVTRYGGEEFAVILPSTEAEGAFGLAEEVRAVIESLKIDHGGGSASARVTISLGTATEVPGPNSSAQVLITSADSALYKAKDCGKNRVEAHSEGV